MSLAIRVPHEWAGTEDGHDCAECDPNGPWRCDRAAHLPAIPADPVAQHLGFVDGVSACAERPCRHGDWPIPVSYVPDPEQEPKPGRVYEPEA